MVWSLESTINRLPSASTRSPAASSDRVMSDIVTAEPSSKVDCRRNSNCNRPPSSLEMLVAITGCNSPDSLSDATLSKSHCEATDARPASSSAGVSLPNGPQSAIRRMNESRWDAGLQATSKVRSRAARTLARHLAQRRTSQSTLLPNGSPDGHAHHDGGTGGEGADGLLLRAVDLHVCSPLVIRLLRSTRYPGTPRRSGGRRFRGNSLRTSPSCRTPRRGGPSSDTCRPGTRRRRPAGTG